MQTKIQKWGKSLGLRIPKAFAAAVQLEEGIGSHQPFFARESLAYRR